MNQIISSKLTLEMSPLSSGTENERCVLDFVQRPLKFTGRLGYIDEHVQTFSNKKEIINNGRKKNYRLGN